MQHLVQKNQNGKVKFISLILDKNTLSREWGIINGKTQTTSNSYEGKNIGKKNELSPCDVAKNAFDRLIERKCKEGYIKTNSLEELPDFGSEIETIDLDNIPTGFCPSKPTKEISDKDMDQLIASGNAKFFLKYNGQCHFILINSKKQVKIFTRRWDDHTIKYPDIVCDVKKKDFPAGTLLLTEFVVDPSVEKKHMEAFRLMSKISKTEVTKGECKPDQTESIKLQKEHPVRAAVFAILYYDNKKFWDKKYKEMLEIIKELIPGFKENEKLFVPVECLVYSTQTVRDVIKKQKELIEGMVVWDLNASIDVTMNGKPNRRAAWKVKAKGEMDVIAFDWIEGNGDLQGKIGSLCICKFDEKGNRIDLGTVGSGLKPKEGDCDIENWEFPCVIEVEYDQIFPDTQRFQFPRFSKRHEDKPPEILGWPGQKIA